MDRVRSFKRFVTSRRKQLRSRHGNVVPVPVRLRRVPVLPEPGHMVSFEALQLSDSGIRDRRKAARAFPDRHRTRQRSLLRPRTSRILQSSDGSAGGKRRSERSAVFSADGKHSADNAAVFYVGNKKCSADCPAVINANGRHHHDGSAVINTGGKYHSDDTTLFSTHGKCQAFNRTDPRLCGECH